MYRRKLKIINFILYITVYKIKQELMKHVAVILVLRETNEFNTYIMLK